MKKTKTKFKVGDMILLENPTKYNEIPEICIVTEVGNKYYHLRWLADSMFWNAGDRDKAWIEHIDKTAEYFVG